MGERSLPVDLCRSKTALLKFPFKIRRRQRRRERQNGNRFSRQNNNFARASRFFVHFVAVIARLRLENT